MLTPPNQNNPWNWKRWRHSLLVLAAVLRQAHPQAHGQHAHIRPCFMRVSACIPACNSGVWNRAWAKSRLLTTGFCGCRPQTSIPFPGPMAICSFKCVGLLLMSTAPTAFLCTQGGSQGFLRLSSSAAQFCSVVCCMSQDASFACKTRWHSLFFLSGRPFC